MWTNKFIIFYYIPIMINLKRKKFGSHAELSNPLSWYRRYPDWTIEANKKKGKNSKSLSTKSIMKYYIPWCTEIEYIRI